MHSINQQLKKAIGLSLMGRYTSYLVQLISLMLYARWFTPEEFGVLAGIQVFVMFFMMLAEIGLGPALINQRKLCEKDRDGLFSLTLLVGITIAIIFYLVTYGLNQFYSRDDYQILGLPICISILFNAASTLPTSFLQREKRFIIIARAEVIAELMTLFIIWLWISTSNQSLYALAIRPLSTALFRFSFKFLACTKTEFGRPKLGRHLCAIKPLLSFSGYQFAFSFVNYFSRNLDNILVGRTLGMTSLGVYDQAYTLMKYPLQLLTFAISPAIQPVLSKHASDLELMEEIHTKFIRKMAVLGVIAGILMLANSNQIIEIMLGNQWLAVGPILQILSIIVPVQVVLSTSGGFFQALNRTDLMFKCGLFSAITNVTSIVIGIFLGTLETLAWCLIVSFHINFLQCYWTIYKKVFDCHFRVLIYALIPAFIISISGFFLWQLSMYFLPNNFNVWFSVLFNCAVIIVGIIFVSIGMHIIARLTNTKISISVIQ